jgi:hypothetical protein
MSRLHFILGACVISATVFILGSAAVGQKDDNGKEDPKKTENEVKKFEYPGAEVGANGVTEREGRSLFYFTMTTSDDLEKVLKHYEESTGQKLTVSAGTVSSRGRDDWVGAVQDDSITRVGNGNERTSPRPMTVRVVSVDAKSYHLTLVFSRAKEEKYTHIVATYVKK